MLGLSVDPLGTAATIAAAEKQPVASGACVAKAQCPPLHPPVRAASIREEGGKASGGVARGSGAGASKEGGM